MCTTTLYIYKLLPGDIAYICTIYNKSFKMENILVDLC